MSEAGGRFERAEGPVAVVGLWHQGVVGAACLASLGYTVRAADIDENVISGLSAGRSPLHEPGLDELVQAGLKAGRLSFTTGLAEAVRGCPYVLLMFDTPVDEKDRSDLAGVLAAVEAIAAGLAPDATILVTSQVPVGTCDRIATILQRLRPDTAASLAYMPENLRLGQAIDRFLRPPLPVLGADAPQTYERVERLLRPLGVSWLRVGLRTAEMTKHALNAFLATCVGFANELGNLCDEVGADGVRVAEVLRLEPRVGPRAMLLPGMAFAGGTLARDVQTLRGLGAAAAIPTPLLDALWESNSRHNDFVLRKLAAALGGSVAGRRVAVLGLTYKPDTSTLRRSASLEIIRGLAAAGANIRGHDPRADRGEVARHPDFEFCETLESVLDSADAVVILTAWPEYRSLDPAAVSQWMPGRIIIDPQNVLDPSAWLATGFVYLDVGRGRRVGG